MRSLGVTCDDDENFYMKRIEEDLEEFEALWDRMHERGLARPPIYSGESREREERQLERERKRAMIWDGAAPPTRAPRSLDGARRTHICIYLYTLPRFQIIKFKSGFQLFSPSLWST